jgi:transposase-like protein
MPTNCAAVDLEARDKWHLDEVFLTIRGERHSLWRAVDQDGNVLDILLQSRRNKKAAKRFFRKLLKGLQYVPRVIITDKLKSYGAAKREILPGVEHRQHARAQQSSGKFTSAHATAREENAALQISQTRATLSLGFQPHCWTFPAAKTSFAC